MELARTISSNAPLDDRRGQSGAPRSCAARPAERDLDPRAALVEACFRSDDYLEGQQAFAEKRSPRFTGR